MNVPGDAPPLGLTLLVENSLHHVAALALRSRTYVSAFALVVYWHNPNRIPIVAARFLGSTAWKKKSISDFIGYLAHGTTSRIVFLTKKC